VASSSSNAGPVPVAQQDHRYFRNLANKAERTCVEQEKEHKRLKADADKRTKTREAKMNEVIGTLKPKLEEAKEQLEAEKNKPPPPPPAPASSGLMGGLPGMAGKLF